DFELLPAVAPPAIRRKELNTANLRVVGKDASGADKLGDRVRLVPVFFGRSLDRFRRLQSIPLPVETSTNCPGEDTLRFGSERWAESRINRERPCEWHKKDTSPHAMRLISNDGPMIHGEEDLCARP